MIKKITCIECPVGCVLLVDIENCRVVRVSGEKCPEGEAYAVSEVENPMRILTSTAIAKGLELNMIPVRTDRPIPKAKIQEAMAEIRKIRITKPLLSGDIIIKNFLTLGVNLISTREVT